jgi:hypothetical protein
MRTSFLLLPYIIKKYQKNQIFPARMPLRPSSSLFFCLQMYVLLFGGIFSGRG